MVDSRKTFAVPDVKPPNEFDCVKAKICASVGWLLAASYGGAENVPAELRDPFYCDQYEQEHLKPPVARLLQSSELYCRTYGLLLGPASAADAEPRPDDNAGLLRRLALRGVACRDRHAEVTDADLQHKPIRMSAHLAVMDALMSVAAMETVMAVRTSGGGELLGGASSWEEALLHWVNQLNNKLRERSAADAQSDGTQGAAVEAEPQPVQPSLRYRKDKVHFKQNPVFPVVKDVTDLTTGCAIAAVLHYYCPGLLRLQDVCMKEVMTAADSAFNLQLIREFCVSCLRSCCQLSVEDMLYAPPELRRNLLSFLAELLHWFEVRRPEFVQPMESSADGSAAATPSGAGSSSPSIFKKPFLPISSPTPGSLNQSASMSHLEGAGRTWSRKPLSRPLSAVSFSIPFGLDSDVDVVMGNPLITRSVSSDQLGPPPHASTAAEAELGQLLAKRAAPNGPQRASWVTQTPGPGPGPGPGRRKEEEQEEGQEQEEGGEAGELPTIEEALQIIHNDSKLEPRLHPDGAPDGFYLHSPDGSATRSGRAPEPPPVSSSAPSRTGMMFRAESKEAARTRNASECSRDDDSVLRDGSVDSDASEDLPKAQSTPSTPAAAAATGGGRGQEAPDSGVKMTSFAERKKKQASDSPQAGEAAPGAACPRAPEDGGGSPQLNTEMSELGVRLEEKRRAIEAQKKRIEAIFAKHRQRLGKSAFMQLKKEQRGEEEGQAPASPSPSDEELSRLTLEERLARMEEEEEERRAGRDGPAGGGPGRLGEKAAAAAAAAGAPGQKMAAPLGDYNNAVSKLTAALSSLQSDMQRLTEQQNQLIHKKTAPSKSWVIPAAAAGAGAGAAGRMSRESTRDLPPSSPSPSRKLSSQATPPKSPQVVHRRAQSAPPKSPKHQQHARSLDSRPALSRVLTPPRNVDRIPHLRRVNPSRSQVQTSSSFSIGDSGSFDDLRSLGATPLPTPSQTPVPGRMPRADSDAASEAGSDYQSIFSMELETGPPLPLPAAPHRKEGSSGAPSECSFESDAPSTLVNGKRGSLIEISLSSLRGEGEDEDEAAPEAALSDSMSERAEPDVKGGVGFFFKDDKERTEDEMAQRRAALLEKQQKRTEEMKRRKQEQEKESNKPQWMIIEGWGNKGEDGGRTPDTPPPARTPPPQPEGGTPVRRGDFTRQEYERRQQLKIMEDLDKVLRQKPTTVRAVKKQRPKTVFRDDSALAHSPVKGLTGSRLNKVYSHSTMNLSSMTHDAGAHTLRRPNSRSHSPARLRSPGRHRENGERDWENGSTISSPASIPEYTGPKLYKEPSFKSNKFIIHNAITRCCLAGKVNEPHKNKIVEEMEKSSANHFLILFRDSSCQFRAVYTMNPETEELQRLTGVGPRLITPDMVESIYKYTSDRKQFTVIPSKTMSMSVDAFTIPGHFWQKRPGTPKKLAAPK